METIYGWSVVIAMFGASCGQPDTLFNQLGHPEFVVREKATKALSLLVNEYDLIDLVKPLRHHDNPEIRHRIHNIIGNYYNPKPTNKSNYPVITAYDGNDDEAWRKAFARAFREDYPMEYNFEGNYVLGWISNGDDEERIATHQWIKWKMIEEGYKRKDIIYILDIMVEAEYWGMKYTIPNTWMVVEKSWHGGICRTFIRH